MCLPQQVILDYCKYSLRRKKFEVVFYARVKPTISDNLLSELAKKASTSRTWA